MLKRNQEKKETQSFEQKYDVFRGSFTDLFAPLSHPLAKWAQTVEVKHLTQHGITAERKPRILRG